MGVHTFPPSGTSTSLTLVGAPEATTTATTPARVEQHTGCGDICVFFEPNATLVRLYGRIDISMRKELVEAAFDVVDRGAPVTIDIAPDADVQPGVLQFLQNACQFGFRGATGAVPPCLRSQGVRAGDDAARGPARRRLPHPRTGAVGSGG